MGQPGMAPDGGDERDGVLLRLAMRTGLVTPAQAAAARERAEGDAETLMELRRSGVLSAEDVEGLQGVARGLVKRGSIAAEAGDRSPEAGGDHAARSAAGSDLQPPVSSLQPGLPRLGPYVSLGELGRGGMGAVYRARHATLGIEVALKVILPGQDASTDAIARFQREARTAAALGAHPGIVAVRDLGEVVDPPKSGEGGPTRKVWFAMDLVEGKSLEALIEARFGGTGGSEAGAQPLDHRRAAEIIEKAARALHFAHAHGVLHRDLKPANILVTAAGEPRIADFGLAKTHDAGPESHRLTKSGAVLGTPAYMSPEQAHGAQTLDARADVYSLGATLYECLTGEPPFTADTVYGLLAKIIRGEPKAPRRLEPRVPMDLDTITLKCLEKDPERRYTTAEALAADLGRWRQGEPITARPVSRLERFAKHVRRNRGPWAVGAVLGAILVGVTTFFGFRAARERAALADDLRVAELLTAADPEQALGVLKRLAERSGADYPGLFEAKARAEARQRALAVERLVERAATSLETGRNEAHRHDGLTQAIVDLRAEGAGAIASPAAALPSQPGDAGLGAGGLDAAGETDPETEQRARTLAEKLRERTDAYGAAQSALRAVLDVLDDHPTTPAAGEARATLARLAWDRLREAEDRGERDDAARFQGDLEAWGQPEYAERLEGRGTLTLDSVPSGAEVRCFEYVDMGGDGRLEETDRGVLGTTPLRDVPLAMGSYVLVLAKPSYRDTRYPVWIEREEAEAPGVSIPLLTADQIGAGYVYVPPGESVLGGDDKAYNAWPRGKRWIEGFCLAEREVTIAEYRAFLQTLITAAADPAADAQARAEGTDQAVTARCPRESARAGHYWLVQNGRLVERTRLADDWPALGISWEDAQWYCRWRSEIEGRAVALPSEAEWERACRGADGRWFPWGDRFSWRWTVGRKSPIQGARPQPKPVLAAAEDTSPFGVRDLAGSVQEWCQNEAADLGTGVRAVRGGGWTFAESTSFRGAYRLALEPGIANATLGLRVRAVPRTN